MNPLILKIKILALELSYCDSGQDSPPFISSEHKRNKAEDLVAAVAALRLEMDLPVPLHPRRPLT